MLHRQPSLVFQSQTACKVISPIGIGIRDSNPQPNRLHRYALLGANALNSYRIGKSNPACQRWKLVIVTRGRAVGFTVDPGRQIVFAMICYYHVDTLPLPKNMSRKKLLILRQPCSTH